MNPALAKKCPTPDILNSDVEGFLFVCIRNEQSQPALT